MRRPVLLSISAGLNVALLAGWGYSHRSAQPAPLVAVATPVVTNLPGRTHVVFRRQVFSWREVESPDYTTYIAHLRDIGCPEPTIRDIIVADVNQLYARKRLAEMPTMDQEWWRSTPDTNRLQTATAKIQSLEVERRTVLATLLGPDWEAPDVNAGARPLVSLNGPVLGALSAETKQAVENIVARSQQRIDDYVAAQQSAGQALDSTELARIRLDARNELAKTLNPAELEEFLLRYSQTAINLRQNFVGLQLTPDEFRNVFRAVDLIDQQLQLDYGRDNPATAAQRAALEKRRADAIQIALGPDRAKEYQLAQLQRDTAFQDAAAAVDAAGAPPTLVNTLYAINQATAQEIARITNDPNLTADQKAAQIKTVQDQQQAARDQVLGQAPTTPPAPPPTPAQSHTFSPGETLDGIANQYGITIGSLLQANPSLNLNQLSKGMQIRIPPVAK